MPRIRETISAEGPTGECNERQSLRLNYTLLAPSLSPGSCVSLISCPRNRCFQSSFSFPRSSKLELSCNYATSVKIDRYRRVLMYAEMRVFIRDTF